jgi:hypothetical protein
MDAQFVALVCMIPVWIVALIGVLASTVGEVAEIYSRDKILIDTPPRVHWPCIE